MTRTDSATVSPIGQRVRRRNGDAFLTGRALYTGDITLPGMVHAAVARSPHAHAVIASIDLTAARAAPGVLAVVTGSDMAADCDEIPHGLDAAHLGGHHAAVYALAVGKVVYVGEPVAAVVAPTQADAQAAALLIEVNYELLPVVLDVEAALAPHAPLLYPEWGDNVLIEGHAGPDDFAEVALDAPHVIDGELRTARGTAAPMEPRSYVASWERATERLTLYATTQNPHVLRTILAASLRMSENKIRVIASNLGGSFGLKMYGNREDFLAAYLTRLVGRPVKSVEDRAATLLPSAREQVLRYRVAHDDDGRLLGVDVLALSDHGAAAATHGWGMAFVGALSTGLGYRLEHCHVRYRVAVTNKAPWGGTKPFGKDGATLVLEHALERVAAATGLDPAEVRRRNFLRPDAFPHRHPTGLELDSGDYATALQMTLDRLSYDEMRRRQAALRHPGALPGHRHRVRAHARERRHPGCVGVGLRHLDGAYEPIGAGDSAHRGDQPGHRQRDRDRTAGGRRAGRANRGRPRSCRVTPT